MAAPPVLDETRGMVLCWNYALRGAVREMAAAGGGGVSFVDFLGDALEGGGGGGGDGGPPPWEGAGRIGRLFEDVDEGRLLGSGASIDVSRVRLRDCMRLDGTHLSPRVAEAVARHLAAAGPAPA